ncbi:hypothetical protein BH18THE1_BH18THE1_10770 [soil metagenome]
MALKSIFGNEVCIQTASGVRHEFGGHLQSRKLRMPYYLINVKSLFAN